jgi:hypothetical protein
MPGSKAFYEDLPAVEDVEVVFFPKKTTCSAASGGHSIMGNALRRDPQKFVHLKVSSVRIPSLNA